MKVTYAKAIGDALKEEMRRDSKVLIYGEDVAQFGNIFGITRGMLEEFGPKRVRNTPITETAIIGSAIGAAETGLRPCVELMYSDFTMVAFTEIFHCVSKWRYMHGPEYKLPLVIRSASGSSNGAGSEHSNTVESLFMHAPGLTIITPSCPYDAKGLLKSAIRSDNPVLFCEPKQLYQVKQEIADDVYESDYTIPIGVADVKRPGKDVTLIAVGLMVPRALEAAEKLAAEGIDVEVIDPRTLVPFDYDTVEESVKKTGRLVVVHEAHKNCGWGAQVIAEVSKQAFRYLDASPIHIGAKACPLPFNPGLEAAVIPSVKEIVDACKATMYR